MDIKEVLKNNFDYRIKERGKDYYKNNNILKVIKNGDTNNYLALVMGSYNSEYRVTINNLDSENFEMNCTCPYEENCKHMYATLLSIQNNEFNKEELLPIIDSVKYNLKEILENIPDAEIKDYFISKCNTMDIEVENELKDKFTQYFPLNNYDYYYNNLYNRALIDAAYIDLLEDYSRNMKKYLDTKNYSQVIIIFKAIIDVFIKFDDILNNRKLVVYLNEISIYSRIAYRQADKNTKEIIEKYTKEVLEIDNLSIYIEDLIITNFNI